MRGTQTWCSRSTRRRSLRPRFRRSICTIRTRSGVGASLVPGTLAFAPVPAPAAPPWWGTGQWHENNRWHNNNSRYYGYHYREPPVIYSTPYNYGYYAPPVVYDNTPGFSITIRP